jgi:uncharacterized protein YbaR (Trm112 family)
LLPRSLVLSSINMLDPELLALLVCPETHQDLVEAGPEEVARLNEAIRQGRIRTASGKEVDQPVDGALIREDGAIAYPVRDEIPVMLVAEGLALPQVDLKAEVKVASRG